MENEQNNNKEVKKKNQRFFASAGVIFCSVTIGVLWLINLPTLFSDGPSLINEDAPKKEEITDFSQVRNDLNKIKNDVGEEFEKIKEQKNQQEKVNNAEDLLSKINANASSSLASTTASTSDLNILKK